MYGGPAFRDVIVSVLELEEEECMVGGEEKTRKPGNYKTLPKFFL